MSRLGEVLFFRNSRFFDQSWFGSDFLMIFTGFWELLGAKMVPRWVNKCIDKLMGFRIALGRALGRQKQRPRRAPAEKQRVETVRARLVGRG